jgi:hypothetical protein
MEGPNIPSASTEPTPASPVPAVEPASQSTLATSGGESAQVVQLALVAAALVGAAALTFAMLSARAAGSETAEVPRQGSVRVSSPAVRARAADVVPDSTGWSHAHAYRWVSNHPRSVAFELESIEQVPVWTTKVHPMLVVRCLAKKTDVFVYTETAARIESEDENHTVGLAFDDNPSSVERWPDSEEHDALFAPDPAAFASRLASARHLRFTFTPHNAQPVAVNFNLQGVDTVVESVRKTCGVR